MNPARPGGGRILVVDDEVDFRSVVMEHLEDLGHHTTGAGQGEKALALARREGFDVALVDLKMPGMGGIELLEALKAFDPGLEVVVLTGHATVDTAVRAMKHGAYDYLLKPCRLAELEAVVAHALEKRRLRLEGEKLREQIRRVEPPAELVGPSPEMEAIRSLIARVAATDSTVLVLGETGTGKELAARAVHRQSPRAGKSFLVLQAGAVPENLLESELFGHVRGAFTGAEARRRGLLELCDGGTLFIDEIGEMPLAAQSKLLRVLESSLFRPVGSEHEVRVDVRFVAATNRDLRQLCAEGKFREDLYYRLNVVSVCLPPLRERKSDIPALIENYLETSALPGARWCRLAPKALMALLQYAWPGNVRELRNVVERALILSAGPTELEHLPREILESAAGARPLSDKQPAMDLATVEREHILRVLEITRGNKVEAARLLKIPRRTLYRRLDRHRLE